jgi:hypothetical protein
VSSETSDGVAPGAGVAAGANDGPGALGTAKGVDCGSGVACGGGVALGDGVADGVFAGEGDCVDGVVDRVEVDGGVCAHRNPPKHDSAAIAESKRTPAFDVFPIASSETVEYTDVYLNGRLTVRQTFPVAMLRIA